MHRASAGLNGTDLYPRIGSYGVIGNMQTCALVSPHGSVDWWPVPNLEDPSLFSRILDAHKGGYFRIAPMGEHDVERTYLDRTNVLCTVFETDSGRVTLTDFMPVWEGSPRQESPPAIFRRVACRDGQVDLGFEFAPRFDYGRGDTHLDTVSGGVRAVGRENRAFLSVDNSLPYTVDDTLARGSLSLSSGDRTWLTVRWEETPDPSKTGRRLLADTVEYWRDWVHDCKAVRHTFGGRWHENVVRAELALKLLIYESGAVASGATTSLPEDVGGVRNWDYRFNWLRDAAFTMQALYNLGHDREMRAYLSWFLDLCHANNPSQLQPLYGLEGKTELTERQLEHLDGYRGSRPVRVGNAAVGQRQLDIYGDVVLAIYESTRFDRDLFDDDDWPVVRDIVEYVCEVWDEPDSGIWEVRHGPQQFVYSKVMCWVALDRGIAIAEDMGFDAPIERWRDVKASIKATVLDRGYNDERQTFVRTFDGDDLDATGLLLPAFGFLPFDDERVQRTVDATIEELEDEHGLVRRYRCDDGLPGDEGAFLWCSFWLVDILALTGRTEAARTRFEDLVGYTGTADLLAEEVDPATGELRGNYPQAFSHVGLVNSALYLAVTAGADVRGPPPLAVHLGEGHVVDSA